MVFVLSGAHGLPVVGNCARFYNTLIERWEALTYHKNGNIKTLVRTDNSSTVVDNLSYTYNTLGQLSTVADVAPSTDGSYQLPGTTTYTYDANGNVETRSNPGSTGNNISGITYNYLNLPLSVTATAGNVTYTYDGTGRKLRSVNGILPQTRDYIDGIEYTSNGTVMELIHTEEGRITRSGTTYTYHYFLKDHLGNNRVGFQQGTDVTTPNFTADFYPFGLQYLDVMRAGSPKINYLYNGKELQDGLKQYDYGARFYDPVIGRWGKVDPLAEKYFPVSPFTYVANSPVNAVDPDGKRIIFVNGYLGFGSYEGGRAYWNNQFVHGAQKYYDDYQKPFYTNFDYKHILSATELRQSSGRKYAEENYIELTNGMDMESDVFRLVTHSMGGAFAEGMIEYLKEQGWKVSDVVHLNAWQPSELNSKKDLMEGINVVDATNNDWVQWLSVSGNKDIPNSSRVYRKKSNTSFQYIHRDLIDSGDEFWKKMSEADEISTSSNNWNSIIQSWLQINPNIDVIFR